MLEIGLLGQGLEVADLHGRDLVVEEILLEGDLLGVGLEEFLGQSCSPGERRFRLLDGGQEVGVSQRRQNGAMGIGQETERPSAARIASGVQVRVPLQDKRAHRLPRTRRCGEAFPCGERPT